MQNLRVFPPLSMMCNFVSVVCGCSIVSKALEQQVVFAQSSELTGMFHESPRNKSPISSAMASLHQCCVAARLQRGSVEPNWNGACMPAQTVRPRVEQMLSDMAWMQGTSTGFCAWFGPGRSEALSSLRYRWRFVIHI